MEEKPDVTYNEVGGCKEQIEKLKEVVETPMLHVSRLHTQDVCTSKYIIFFLAREVCQVGNRAAQGCAVVWASWHWEDAMC